MAEFCQRVQAELAAATFEQKRPLVELLIDRVVVAHGEVEIRYVLPTHPRSEKIRFCHLRKDYFDHIIQVAVGAMTHPFSQFGLDASGVGTIAISCCPVGRSAGDGS